MTMSKVHFKELRGVKYELTEMFMCQTALTPKEYIKTKHIELSPSGMLTLQPGFKWDGCSGPTFDDKTNHRAGLVHDALYGLMGRDLISRGCRKYADNLFHRMLREDGMPRFRAWYYWRAVRKFGGIALALNDGEPKERTAP